VFYNKGERKTTMIKTMTKAEGTNGEFIRHAGQAKCKVPKNRLFNNPKSK